MIGKMSARLVNRAFNLRKIGRYFNDHINFEQIMNGKPISLKVSSVQ